MSLTKIDCFFARGPKLREGGASYAAVNPSGMPGSLVAACSSEGRDAVGGQLASRLGLEKFTESILESFESPAFDGSKLLEEAFKMANDSVFELGQKLYAGGRLAASLIGAIIHERAVSVARAGKPEAYLFRGGALHPFFSHENDNLNVSYVGAASTVSVQLSSVPIEALDVLILAPSSLTTEQSEALTEALIEFEFDSEDSAQIIARSAYRDLSDLDFFLVARIGPETIYLNQEVPDVEALNLSGS